MGDVRFQRLVAATEVFDAHGRLEEVNWITSSLSHETWSGRFAGQQLVNETQQTCLNAGPLDPCWCRLSVLPELLSGMR